MATWIAINSVRLTVNGATVIIREGDLVSDTTYDLTRLRGAGLQLVSSTDAAAAVMQTQAQVAAREGHRDDERRDLPWWGTYARKGQITIAGANTSGTLAFTGAEPDTNYFVSATPSASTGNASPVIANVTKNAANVVLTLVAAPAGSNSITWDVVIFR